MATLKSNVQSDFSSLGISCSASACVQASRGLATPSCCCFNKLSLTNGYLAQGIVQCLPHPEVERDTPKFSFQITVFEQKFCNENGLLCVAVRATFMLTILSWSCQNHHLCSTGPWLKRLAKSRFSSQEDVWVFHYCEDGEVKSKEEIQYLGHHLGYRKALFCSKKHVVAKQQCSSTCKIETTLT